MERPTERPAAPTLLAAAVLAGVAGCIDAVCFASVFQVFPANQSGNAVLLGIGIGDVSAPEMWRPAVAMAGFAVGVLAAVVVRRGRRVPAPTRVLLTAEVVLLVAVTLGIGSVLDLTEPLAGARAAVLLGLTSIAMGVQTEVIRTHAGVTLSTTYQTGALTTIAEDLGAPPGSGARSTSRTAIAILALVLVGYVAGAALGARLSTVLSATLTVPVVVLVVVLASEPWWGAASRRGPGGSST